MKFCYYFFDIYYNFRALVRTQHYDVIKYCRCNLDGEYISSKVCDLLALDGTINETYCTNIIEQNDVERKNGHIVETAHSFLLPFLVLSEFWRESFLITINLINKIPLSISLSLSLLEKLYRHNL